MFSLIITVISVALVAALALATLYYGGAAFGKGAARAEASKIVLQGQQLLGAADLYYTANRRWPANIEELVNGNYLKQVPNAQASGLSEALAAGQPWAMVANTPTFYIPTAALDVCAEVNLSASLRKRGVLRQAYTGLVAQCYGESALTTVFRKATTDSFQPGADVATDPLPPTDPTDPDWTLPPGTEVTPPGGGGGGATSVTITPGSWTASTAPFTPVSRVFTVTNNTSENMEVWNQWLDNWDRFYFDTSSSQDCSQNWELSAGESCTYTIVFDGESPDTDTLWVQTANMDGDTVELTVNLTGTVSNPNAMSVAPVHIDSPIDVGTATNSVTVPVTNIGTESVTVATASTSTPFVVATGPGAGSCDAIGAMSPGQSCNLTVSIVPGDTAGAATGKLIVAGTSGTQTWLATADLTGIAVKAGLADPTTLPTPTPTTARITDYETCTQPLNQLEFDMSTGTTSGFCVSGSGARANALRNLLQNNAFADVVCGRFYPGDFSNPSYYFDTYRVEGSDGYRFQLSTVGYDYPNGQPNTSMCPEGYSGYLHLQYTDYFVTFQTWTEGIDLNFTCSGGNCDGAAPGGGGGGGGGGGSNKTDYITQAGVNLFEVPVNTPWSGNCSGSAAQYNTCAAAATRIGGAFSNCQVFGNERSPSGGNGTYQSRISCTK